MNSHIQIVLLLIFIFLVLILVLWFSNTKDQGLRFHQLVSAALAPVYAFLVYLIYANNFFSSFLSWIDDILSTSIESSIQEFWLAAIPPFLFFSFAILLFIPIKKLFIWLVKSEKIFTSSPALSLGIYEDKSGRTLLQNNFYYPLKYMYASVIIFSVVYCLSFFSYTIGVPFPAYILLLIFIFLETFWFLNGRSELSDITIELAPAAPSTIDFEALWNDYKETWKDNLSLAFIKRSTYSDWPSSKIEGEMLIKNYKKNKIFRAINKHMIDLLNKGKKIIIFIPDNFQPLSTLEESDKYQIVSDLLFGSDFINQFVTTDIMKLKFESSIYITSIDKFLIQPFNIESDPVLHSWFKSLRLVLYFGYDNSLIESPESSVSASSIIKYLSDNPSDLTSIVFAEDREAQQASWKSNLKTNPQKDREIKINDSESENTYYLGWKAEKPFEAGLLNNYANRYIGPLVSLIALPYIHGIRSIDIKPNQEPFDENFENNEDRDDWKDRYEQVGKLSAEALSNYTNVHKHNLSISHAEDKVLIVNDHSYNAPFLYKYYNEFGKKNHLINIISPPHILREYFNDNFEYFSKNPIKPLSYVLIAGDKYTLALSLLEKLVKCKLTLRELAQDFSDIQNDEQVIIKQLRDLFNEVYTYDILKTSYLEITESKEGELSFSLKPDIKDHIELFKKVEFYDRNKNLVFIKNKNLFFQKYLQGQVHTFAGRMYTIRQITSFKKDIVVTLENTEKKENFSYMEKKKVKLDQAKGNWKKIESKNPTNEYSLNIYSKPFSVSTSGYFELNDGNSLAKGRFTVHEVDVEDRIYRNGRVCKISFANYSALPNFRKANITLRIVLEEVFKVLFPDSFHYLIVRCFGNRINPVDNIISQYYSLDNILESEEQGQAGIYIFEDSVFDMGHLKSIIENIEYIFKIIDDYFSYVIGKIQKKRPSIKKLEHHSIGTSEYFLAFKLKEIKNLEDFWDPIDIQSAKNLSSKCVRVHNDRFYDRWGLKIPSGPVRQTFNGSCKSCDKLGCSGDNAELLDDGRIICNDCKKENHRTQSEEKRLVDIAKKYFETYQSLPDIASIRFTNHQEIRMSVSTNISRFPHAAIRVSKNSKNFEILVENYRNDLETCCGLLHAFIHIWHLKHLAAKKLSTQTDHLDGHTFLIMERFLNSEDLHLEFSSDDCKALLSELKIYKSNYFQKALQKLTKDSGGKELFLYLVTNYRKSNSSKEEEFQLFDF